MWSRQALLWLMTVASLGIVVAGCRPEEQVEVRKLPDNRTTAVTYVALGDSTVAGVGASSPAANYVSRLHERLRSIYPAAEMTNLGMSGATSADVVRMQLPAVVELNPHLVTLSIGPNDITQGRDVSQYERNIEQIFQALTRETEAVVVVNLLPDMAVAPVFSEQQKEAVGQQARQYNEVLQRLGQQYAVEIVDLYTPSQQEVPGQPELVATDHYHPSDEGYERWAEVMWSGVERRIAG